MTANKVPRVLPTPGRDVTSEDKRRVRSIAESWMADKSFVHMSQAEINAWINADDKVSEALDAIAVDRARALYGRRVNFSADQLIVLRMYLSHLAYECGRVIHESLLAEAQARAGGPQRETSRSVPAKPRPLAPAAQPYGVGHKGAELLIRDWMLHLRIADARVTSYSKDGGVDVESGEFVAQVKHQAGNVGRPDVQRLAGVAFSRQKSPLFFTSASYTPDAINWAGEAQIRMPLFRFSPESATLTGINQHARDFLSATK